MVRPGEMRWHIEGRDFGGNFFFLFFGFPVESHVAVMALQKLVENMGLDMLLV